MLVEPARERQRTAVSKPPGSRETHSTPGFLRHPRGGFEVDCSFVAVRPNQLRRGHEQASSAIPGELSPSFVGFPRFARLLEGSACPVDNRVSCGAGVRWLGRRITGGAARVVGVVCITAGWGASGGETALRPGGLMRSRLDR